MERHRQAVRLVSAAVRAFFERSEPYRIWHGSTNSTRPPHQKAGAGLVDISGLKNVLSVDATHRTALVEPNVPMDRLVEHTLRHGLVPPVVMEFPGITTGGGFAGTAGESSSFKHGYFDENVRGVEIVLPDGEVVFAKPGDGEGEHGDLFKGAAGALGTLGVATLLELRLIEAKRFVRTTYRRTSSVAEAVRVVKEECEGDKGNDYVDGILFSKDHGVVISGKMTDELPENEKVQTFSRAWDPWYYMHVRERTEGLPSSASSTPKDGSVTEYIPLAEYLFRYDRGGFWVGQAAFDYFLPVPFNRFFRWFLDDFLHTRMLYRALHGSGESGRFVVQDVGMPYEAAEPLVDYVSDHLNIWPLWLCPLKTPEGPSFHPHLRSVSDLPGERTRAEKGEMLNIGVWGWGPRDRDAFVRANRDLERRVDELGGMKWLYAHTYYSEPEFWRAYGGHRGRYEALRDRYKAASLPTVYDKVRVKVDRSGEQGWKAWIKATWPFGGIVGLWKSIKSRDYMINRRATWKWKGGDGREGKEKVA
ncbi:FAD-binding domain-containing protein [Annulohypoxylon bovei var. microspora]|nr:FAD-binding domain-containing protein [Annulohypoxylon bovei var. microspora]